MDLRAWMNALVLAALASGGAAGYDGQKSGLEPPPAVETVSGSDVLSECRGAGLKKLLDQARAFGVTIDRPTFRLSGADRGWFASYFWWSADILDPERRPDLFPPDREPVLTVLTQKSPGRPCF